MNGTGTGRGYIGVPGVLARILQAYKLYIIYLYSDY